MKTWNYRTYKGRRFYRLNHAELSKDKFFLSYYRILHTAYLNGEVPCISSVKKMFEESFGSEPKAWSLAYITNTETCFLNDAIVDSLNNSGKFISSECLRQMLIEIGFDVYLMQTIDDNKKPNRKEFYRWLPLKKGHRLKKMVNNFWKQRLPKEKLLTSLYYQLESYKNEILMTYRKLLIENDILVIPTIEKDNVLTYIDTVLEVSFVPNDETVQEGTSVGLPEADATPSILVSEHELVPEAETVVQQPVVIEERPPQRPVQNASVHHSVVQKRRTVPTPDGRGFHEKNEMTRKKAVTCAVCVAAAGALLVPLVAYSVIKHKAAN